MSDQPDKEPFNEANLEDPEYRERLMRKLNCLIAVLEVANAKVKRSLSGPAPDLERLNKIKTNLSSTLEVCRRAKRALERREALPEGLPENLAQVVERTAKADQLPARANVEMSSSDEHKRFEAMGRISKTELADVDLDDLARQLQQD
jgi:regulator of sirC expression with transglutaminase-like and TPR domain